MNKLECLTALAAFAVKAALIAVKNSDNDFAPKMGRKLTLEGFTEYMMERGFNADIPQMLKDYLGSETLHEFEIKKAMAEKKRAEKAKSLQGILSEMGL